MLGGFLGRPLSGREPYAEYWLGAHPAASARLETDGGWTPLAEVIRQDPEGVLGAETAERFGGALPFLLKVIAVGRPLSLQAHPDASRARAGFARENAQELPRDAPERCYPDPSPKPELVHALGPFTTLVGFRPAGAIEEDLARLQMAELGPLPSQPASLCTWLEARSAGSEIGSVLERVVARVRGRVGSDAALGWVVRLAEQHPQDPAVLAPLFMNLVTLERGQSLFIPPGVLHCHLEGLAVELMANSDNVVRGGLTSKHVDLDELARVVSSGAGRLVDARRTGAGMLCYPTAGCPFELSLLEVKGDASLAPGRVRGPEILLCGRGSALLRPDAGAAECRIARGEGCLIPASVARYRIEGDASLYRASLPGRVL